MKRLVADNSKSIEQMIKSTASEGRDILKALEQFKFKLEQCVKVSQNEEINNKVHQHYDMVDKLMSGLYTICYDMENVNLVPLYDNDQIDMSNQDAPDSDNSGYKLNEEYPLPDEEESTDDYEESSEDNDSEEENSDEDSESDESEEEESSESEETTEE